VVVESRGDRLWHVGDLVGHPLHVAHPDWPFSIDTNPE
jgi:hypothetical protein